MEKKLFRKKIKWNLGKIKTDLYIIAPALPPILLCIFVSPSQAHKSAIKKERNGLPKVIVIVIFFLM